MAGDFEDGAGGAIVPCPPRQTAEALSLVLGELAPADRAEVAGPLVRAAERDRAPVEGLYCLLAGDVCRAAAWGQRQPGRTAAMWPARFAGPWQPEAQQAAAAALSRSVVTALDAAGIEMAQALVSSREDQRAAPLEAAGFRRLAELVYLACEAEHFAAATPGSTELEFVAYDETQRDRLAALIERTYEGTLDCPALEGRRQMDDVLAGYRATGEYRAENWLIARAADRDVGVLLTAAHPGASHVELVYMGLVPEARGRGWGRLLAEEAQRVARRAGAERIVLAVDAANRPALEMYASTRFLAWSRRTVLVRFAAS